MPHTKGKCDGDLMQYTLDRNKKVEAGKTIYAQNKAEMIKHIVKQEKEIKELKNTIKTLIKRREEGCKQCLSTL